MMVCQVCLYFCQELLEKFRDNNQIARHWSELITDLNMEMLHIFTKQESLHGEWQHGKECTIYMNIN